jgi:uncharacterized RDD family membrane protein YckC
MSPSGSPRAGLMSRLGAFFVDAVILSVTLRSTAWLFRGAGRMLGRFAPPVKFDALIVAWAPLMVALYLVIFWTASGQTPGKLLFGLRVVPMEGGRLPLRRALLRLFGYLLSALPVYLGFLWIAGPARRGWHDRLARTEVVYARRRAPIKSTPATELRARIGGVLARDRPVVSH